VRRSQLALEAMPILVVVLPGQQGDVELTLVSYAVTRLRKDHS